jgi:hypothetical protein
MTRISAAALYLMLWEAIELANRIWPVTFGNFYRSIQFETEPAAISGSRACLNMAGKVISSETHGA